MKTGVTVLLRNGHQIIFANSSMEEWDAAMWRASKVHEQQPATMNFLGSAGEAYVRYEDVVAYWKT